MKATTGKDPNATYTAESALPQHEEDNYDDDDDVVVTSCPVLKEVRTTKGASHKEAHLGKKPTVTKSKTVEELDTEAKRAAARKEYESQGVEKAKAICEQRLVEEIHDAYYFDGDKEYEKCLSKECFAEHCCIVSTARGIPRLTNLWRECWFYYRSATGRSRTRPTTRRSTKSCVSRNATNLSNSSIDLTIPPPHPSPKTPPLPQT